MSRPINPTPRPTPPPRVSAWGVGDAVARRYGYPRSRPPSDRELIAHLERMADWLAERLELLADRMEAMAAEAGR